MYNKLRLYDTETTTLNGEIVEVAYVDIVDGVIGQPVSHLIKPYSPIHYEAIATHGITDEMVLEAPRFSDMVDFYAPDDDMFVGSHNWNFDKRMLDNPVFDKPYICTLELAKKLLPKGTCTSHKNMVLYYYLELHKKYALPEGVAHRAAFDVECTARVLVELMNRFDMTLEDCYNLLNKPKEFICNFTKHRGKLWSDVLKDDRQYVEWLVGNNKLQVAEDRDKLIKMMEDC